MDSLGKLKRTLKTRCPDCGSVLQIRTISVKKIEYGEEILVDEDYVVCPNCGETQPADKKKGNHRRIREE